MKVAVNGSRGLNVHNLGDYLPEERMNRIGRSERYDTSSGTH